jgi:hypothetical protein
VALDLTVLNRLGAEQVVEFDGLVGGSAGLVLRGVLAEPEVDIPTNLWGILLLVGVQDNVRVTVIELTVLLLWP